MSLDPNNEPFAAVAEAEDANEPYVVARLFGVNWFHDIVDWILRKVGHRSWIDHVYECVVTDVDTDTKRCKVFAPEHPHVFVENVRYGEFDPIIDQTAALRQPTLWRGAVYMDPWIHVETTKRGRKWAYYEWGGLYKVPWPLTDPHAEPILVHSSLFDSAGLPTAWHPEQNLGFDGKGTWWVEANWETTEGSLSTTHFYLVGWDKLGTGDPSTYFYGTVNAATKVGLKPRVWAVDSTPGHTGFMGFWYGSGPATHAGTPSVTGAIAFANAPDGEWALGPSFLMNDLWRIFNPPGPPYFGSVQSQGGKEYWRQIFEHNAYWFWNDGDLQRALWGLQPGPNSTEDSLHFYNESSDSAALSDAGYQAFWWAGLGDRPNTFQMIVVGSTFDAVTRRDPDGTMHALTMPPNPRYPAGQDRTLTDLLMLDRSGVYWASENRGDTWYQCPYQLPNRTHDEGGKWVYIIDESEYGG